MKKLILMISVLTMACCLSAQEQSQPYDPNASAVADIKKAVDQAKKENKHVLVQFGGNWCPWCIRFHAFVHQVPDVDSLVKADYIYVLANVPREKDKRDYQLFRNYDFPNRFGYPVFVVLDGSGKKLHIQDSGLLENPDPKVKGYDTTKVVTFLRQWNVKALDPATYMDK